MLVTYVKKIFLVTDKYNTKLRQAMPMQRKKKRHILKLTIIHLYMYTAPKGRGGAGGEKERERTFVGNKLLLL